MAGWPILHLVDAFSHNYRTHPRLISSETVARAMAMVLNNDVKENNQQNKNNRLEIVT